MNHSNTCSLHLVKCNCGARSNRRVWVATLQEGAELPPGTQVMIEQFDDQPPAIAFRQFPWETWGPPTRSEVAP
jgi:hypothetical protein